MIADGWWPFRWKFIVADVVGILIQAQESDARHNFPSQRRQTLDIRMQIAFKMTVSNEKNEIHIHNAKCLSGYEMWANRPFVGRRYRTTIVIVGPLKTSTFVEIYFNTNIHFYIAYCCSSVISDVFHSLENS